MLEGMDLGSKSFKALNRLFLRASNRTGSGLGLGTTNPSSGEHSSTGLSSRGATGVGSKSGDAEWRHRLKTKLHHGSIKESIHSQSPTGSDRIQDTDSVSGQDPSNPEEDIGETPLGTLRIILESPHHQGVVGALRWLTLMVQSGVAVPTQAFVECSKGLVDMSNTPVIPSVDNQPSTPAIALTASAAAGALRDGNNPQRPSPSLSAPATSTASGSVAGSSAFQQLSLRSNRARVLYQSQVFLTACWESLPPTSASQNMSESDAGKILELVLAANQETVTRVMFERLHDADPKELEWLVLMLPSEHTITTRFSGPANPYSFLSSFIIVCDSCSVMHWRYSCM